MSDLEGGSSGRGFCHSTDTSVLKHSAAITRTIEKGDMVARYRDNHENRLLRFALLSIGGGAIDLS